MSRRTSFHNAGASLIIVLCRSCACRSLRKTECALKCLTCVECNTCFLQRKIHSLCRYGCIIVAAPWPKVAEINSMGLVKPSNLLGSWRFFHRKDPAHLLNLGGFGALLAILPLERPPCHDVLKPRAVCDGGLPKS